MNKFKFIIPILIICVIVFKVNFANSYPYEKEVCNLGWEHVKHEHNEASYQHIWCKAHGGIEEYENKDYTRVDCLTSTHAVEFDFGNKWAESIGQALHYSIMTNKKPMIVMILENPKTQMVYFKRTKKIADRYGIDIEYVTNDILNLDNFGRCKNPDCRCHRD